MYCACSIWFSLEWSFLKKPVFHSVLEMSRWIFIENLRQSQPRKIKMSSSLQTFKAAWFFYHWWLSSTNIQFQPIFIPVFNLQGWLNSLICFLKGSGIFPKIQDLFTAISSVGNYCLPQSTSTQNKITLFSKRISRTIKIDNKSTPRIITNSRTVTSVTWWKMTKYTS